MALSVRLNTLKHIINRPYDHIWDTCCDHGLLGKALLDDLPATQIHFVDRVPALINALSQSLSNTNAKQWHCHTECVTNLPLTRYEGRHLVIIAGVGGDLIASFLDALQARFKHLEVDYLVCGVHHAFTLRTTMNALNLGLLNEVLIEENSRFYEVIYATNQQAKTIVTTSATLLWQSAPDAKLRAYLSQLINHYGKVSKGKPEQITALDSYQTQLNALKEQRSSR